MNLWGWIKPFLDWLTAFIEKKAKEPHTLEDENTPKDIRDKWSSYLADKLRDKNGGN